MRPAEVEGQSSQSFGVFIRRPHLFLCPLGHELEVAIHIRIEKWLFLLAACACPEHRVLGAREHLVYKVLVSSRLHGFLEPHQVVARV